MWLMFRHRAGGEVIQNVLQLAREDGAIPEMVEKTYRAMIAAFIAAEHREHDNIWKTS